MQCAWFREVQSERWASVWITSARSGCHWQTESNILMETCWVMIDWVVEIEQESRRSAERWSISPINIYCTPSQQPTLAVSVCVTGTVVEIPLTLCMDRLLEPLRSDFNHILWLFTVTRMRYCYLQEILSHLCLLFLDTNFLYKEETLQHIISSQE